MKAKVIISMFIAVIMLMAGIAVGASNEKPTIKVGWSLPLTGAVAMIGQGMKKAALMAKDEIGASNYNWEFLFEDDKLDSKIAASIGNKYIHVDKVDVTATTSGSTGNVLARLADQNDRINFSITVDPGTEKGYSNFAHFTQNQEQNTLLVHQIKKNGFKRPAAFVNISLTDYVAIYKNLSTKIDLLATGEVQNDQKNFRTEITKVLKVNPDIIIICLRSPILEILTRQLRELGYEGRLTCVSAFNSAKDLNMYEGEFFVGGADHSNWFRDLWKAKYGDEPPRAAGYAYDVVKLIVFAVENAGIKGKPTSKQISDALYNIKYYPGAVGSLRVLPSGRIWSPASLMKIQNGKIIHVKAEE